MCEVDLCVLCCLIGMSHVLTPVCVKRNQKTPLGPKRRRQHCLIVYSRELGDKLFCSVLGSTSILRMRIDSNKVSGPYTHARKRHLDRAMTRVQRRFAVYAFQDPSTIEVIRVSLPWHCIGSVTKKPTILRQLNWRRSTTTGLSDMISVRSRPTILLFSKRATKRRFVKCLQRTQHCVWLSICCVVRQDGSVAIWRRTTSKTNMSHALWSISTANTHTRARTTLTCTVPTAHSCCIAHVRPKETTRPKYPSHTKLATWHRCNHRHYPRVA